MVLWNHAMVGAGHAAYTDRFHELARLVPHLVNPKSRMIERYISGALTDEAVRNGSITKVEKIGNVGETSKDCRGVPRNVNLVNARNPTVRACYECCSTDHGRGNQGNQDRGRAFMLGVEEACQDLKHCDGRTWGCVCKWQPYGCSYKEFLACNPKEYDGKGGVVVLTRWIKKMKNMQDMSGCSNDQKVKYTAGLFVGKALTWWKSQIHTLSQEVAVSMSWNDFKFSVTQ
ncbi:hypothetical protein Tco_1327069 [Tanacetum coccineum]